MKRILSLIIFMAVVVGVYAQSGVNPGDMDFGTNLVSPAVEQKAHAPIVSHMNNIRKALHNHGFDVKPYRDGEAVVVTIPCADVFAPNDTVIKAGGSQKLAVFKDFLKYPTMYKLIVAVYADDTGDQHYSDNITAIRANKIDDYLIELGRKVGVSDINVVPFGMGYDDPVVPNNSIVNRSANRRVDIYVIPEWQMVKDAKSGKLN